MSDTPHPAHPEPAKGPETIEGKITALSFTPVPRLKRRSNGWAPAVQLAFIEALAESGSVRAACRRIGRSDHGAYLLRRHPEAVEFRAAWDAEQAERAEAEHAVLTGPTFLEELEQMHRRWYAGLSRRTRAAYRAFRRLERADKAAGYMPYADEVAEGEAEYAAGATTTAGLRSTC